MKKMLITSLVVVMCGSSTLPILAQASNEDSTISSELLKTDSTNLQEYDKYVTVKNNQYVLELPENVSISTDTQQLIKQQIKETNKAIIANKLTINLNTKIAYLNGVSSRSEGRNGIEFHWNFVRVWLTATVFRASAQGGIAAAGVLATALGVSTGTAVIIAGVVGAVASIVGDSITNGIWFDYNYFNGIFTNNWGWQ